MLLSPDSPEELGGKEAPESPIGKKRKAAETGKPIHHHKIGPVTATLHQDRLDKVVTSLSEHLSSACSWEDFVKHHQGKSYLAPAIDNIHHSTRGLLQDFRDKGVFAPMDNPPWTPEAIDQCAQRGPHPSANLHWEFLCTEMADFIKASFWVVLPLEQVRDLKKDFCLSPVAVKEEVNHWPWVIVDHTWFRVNDHMVVELPLEVMQFG